MDGLKTGTAAVLPIQDVLQGMRGIRKPNVENSMARKGITLEAVQNAVNQIEARGERVTQLAVRHALGNTGSLSTISKHLEAIRSHRMNQPHQLDDLPDDLAAAISQSVATLWQHAQTIAKSDIDSIRHAALERTQALQREVDEMCIGFDEQSEELGRIQSALEQSLEELKASERALVVVETEKTELEKHNATLLSRLDSQEAAIEKLTAQISLNVEREDTCSNRGKNQGAVSTTKQ